MSKKISMLVCITLVLWGMFSTQDAHNALGQSYVDPVALYRVRWGGGVYGGSVVLTADPSQANALGRLDGAEVLVLGMVFNRQMPNTVPLYRLSKPLTGKDSPERYYTTSKTKVDDLVKNHGWASEGILAYVSRGLDGGTKPLYHLSKSGAQFYTTDPAEVKRYKEVAGYRDEGVEAQILEHPFGWTAESWMFSDSVPATSEPRPESYALICRRGKGATFGKDGVFFKFVKGASKAGAELASGECTWPDRKMSVDEPDILLAPLTNVFSPSRTHRDEEYWTFKVYNDGRGRMIVTAAEPGRPPVPDSVEIRRDVKVPETIKPDIRRVDPVRQPQP